MSDRPLCPSKIHPNEMKNNSQLVSSQSLLLLLSSSQLPVLKRKRISCILLAIFCISDFPAAFIYHWFWCKRFPFFYKLKKNKGKKTLSLCMQRLSRDTLNLDGFSFNLQTNLFIFYFCIATNRMGFSFWH